MKNLTGNAPNDERYTPPAIIRLARRVMGGIDCDPASCAQANETVGAAVYYDRNTNGLIQPWVGRVWLNPPYSRDLLYTFVLALFREIASGRTTEAITLTNNATETRAIQALFRGAQAACFPSSRIAFLGDDLDGQTGGYQGQVVCYYGARPERFMRVFAQLGVVLVPGRVRQADLFGCEACGSSGLMWVRS